jgi:DNA invertase Pin-like site-specific DNA recombinase
MATREQILEGMRRAAEKGRFPGRPLKVSDAKIKAAMHLGASAGARKVGLTPSQFRRRRRKIEVEELQNGQ